jgi:hypothetical protein
MPAEDRDRSFEKALARHLRADAGGDFPCLDGEALAAYYEGTLSLEERSAAENHLVSCPRCQEILALLDSTETAASAPRVAIHGPKEAQGKVARPAKRWLLGWAAPAAAVAAGLLLYVSVRDHRSPEKQAESATQIAENRKDNAGARDSYVFPEATPRLPQASPKQKDDDLRAEASRQQAAKPDRSDLRDEMESLRRKTEQWNESKARKKSVPALKPNHPPVGTIAGGAQSGGRITALEQGKNPAKTKSFDASARSDAEDSLTNRTDLQPSQSLQTSGAASGAPVASPSSPAPPPPLPSSASQQVTVMAAAPEASAAALEVAPKEKAAKLPVMSRNVIDKALLAKRMVVASNGKSIWRFGEQGAIAHSGDAGRTWKSQVLPVTATLTSGSAPGKNICWIAGAAGTLVRTTDGGKHWQIIVTPIAADLGGVMASDGKHASIWDMPRQTTYQTSNGGKTWEKKTAD